MKAVRIAISDELLRVALNMPDSATIEHIARSVTYPHTFDFLVSSPDLADVLEGERIPEQHPVVVRHIDSEHMEPKRTYRWYWRQEDVPKP